jgi:rhodanese-related sulfurtransferase
LKFIVDNMMLVLVAVASGAMLLWPLVRKGTGGPWVGTARAVELINREDALLLDVRDPGEYGAGHILGARNLSVARIEEGGGEIAKRKDRPVIVYCEGTERSAKALGALKKQGFTKAFNLSGGLNAWQQAGLPLEK